MPDERDDGNDQEDVNESSANREEKKSQRPKDEDHQRYDEKHGTSLKGFAASDRSKNSP
jgi:hypothetical protein